MSQKTKSLSFGAHLKKTREAKGLSIEDIAVKLKLSVKVVQDLEEVHFPGLPAPAFVRGYIRSYAALVNVSSDPLIADYNAREQCDPDLCSTSSTSKQPSLSDPTMLIATLSILILIAVLVSIWAFGLLTLPIEPKQKIVVSPQTTANPKTVPPVDHGEKSSAESHAEVVAVDQESEQEGEQAVIDPPSLIVPVQTQSETQPVSETNSGSEQTAMIPQPSVEDSESQIEEQIPVPNVPATASVAAAENKGVVRINAQAPLGRDTLTLMISGDSWAEIEDSQGFQLVYGMLSTDHDHLVLTGQAPFKIFLGNATRIELMYQGEPYEYQRYIRRNKVARFLVPEQ